MYNLFAFNRSKSFLKLLKPRILISRFRNNYLNCVPYQIEIEVTYFLPTIYKVREVSIFYIFFCDFLWWNFLLETNHENTPSYNFYDIFINNYTANRIFWSRNEDLESIFKQFFQIGIKLAGTISQNIFCSNFYDTFSTFIVLVRISINVIFSKPCKFFLM